MDNDNVINPPSRAAEVPDVHLAKLSMPRLARGVARPRLYNLLDEARKKTAVWIVAPGGTGKTTLVATYIVERQLPFLWYQMDRDDADPATFFYYLGLAAKQAQPSQKFFLPLLTPEYLPDIPGFARRYFRDLFALLPRGTVLVLDNYQELAEAGVFSEILRSGMTEVPEDNNIVVISRLDPPPELARHQAIGALESIGWEELRLTLGETEAIVSRSRELGPDSVRALHQRSEGWAAGLVLLMEQIKRKGDINQVLNGDSLQTVFDFFTSEYFVHLPAATQDFLLCTSLFAHLTPTLAEEASGNYDAGKILADLHRRHFFIDQRGLAEVTYQYHALFREFLLKKAERTYSRARYLELQRRAGHLLNRHGRNEEAVALYLQAQDWESAAPLILAQAPVLLTQGRAQSLAAWILQIPEEKVIALPWLLYWRGITEQFVNPFAARVTLEEAHERFASEREVLGQLLTASAIIDIVFFLRESQLSTVRWIEVLQDYLNTNLVFPSPSIEARVLSSLFSVLMYMRPQEPKLALYAQRLTALLDSELDANQKVQIAAHLVNYYAHIGGNIKTCDCIMTRVRPLLDSPEVTAINRILWRCFTLLPCLLAGRKDEAYETVRPLPSLVKDNNLPFMEFIASFFVVLANLHLDNAEAAQPLLERMAMLVNTSQPADVAWFYVAKCWYSLSQGDRAAALAQGQASLQAVSRVGAVITEMDISCLIAVELCESGRAEEALNYLVEPRKQGFGNSPRLRHQVLQIEAYAYLRQNDQATCHDRLREAFAIGRSQHYFGSIYCWFPKSMMSRLCVEALRAEIEVDHVRQLIKRRGLFPEDPTIDCWPWPVRVYTLGQFKLVVEDQPRVLETKGSHKPLRLLEVLIALGGTEVKEQRISEILWPDAEGDAAHSAFTTTLSRLRKLIGDETIIVRNGRVSLDEQRCWVDASALERHLDRADEAGSDSERTAGPAEKFMALYQGPFLRDEDQEWPRRLRNRLRAKLSRFLMRCGRNLSAAGEAEQAVHLFEQALEIDPSAEDFYRGLIAIYAGSGQNTEALVTYARCREILFRDFGTAPSQETEALFRNIESKYFPVTEQGQATH